MRTTNKTRMPDCMIMADRTLFRGIGRIDIDHPTTFSYSFIFNKALELPKSPLMHPFVVSCSFSDVAYVLKDNSCSCFHIINNLFTNVVILPSHKPSPSIAERFEFSFGRFCAFSLKLTNQLITLDSEMFNLLPEELFVRCDSETIYANINPKNLVMEARAFEIDIFSECKQEKASSFFIHSKQTFFDIPMEVFFVAIWDCEWNFNSTFNGCQTQDIVLEGSTAREVIPHTDFIYNWLRFGFFYHTTSLSNASYCELALQPTISKKIIHKRLKSKTVSNFTFPSIINTILQPFFVNFKSLNYLRCCIKFDFSCCSYFHKYGEEQIQYKTFGNEEDKCPMAIHPSTKVLGVLANT